MKVIATYEVPAPPPIKEVKIVLDSNEAHKIYSFLHSRLSKEPKGDWATAEALKDELGRQLWGKKDE